MRSHHLRANANNLHHPFAFFASHRPYRAVLPHPPLSTMAFVSATPILPYAASSAIKGRSLAASNSSTPPESLSVPQRPPSMMTPIEFQTYSGGLDRVSIEPYNITRYLFKNPPATLYEQDKDAVIIAGLRQVFGNAYLMDEERAEFYVAESKFRCGEITAKEFVRAVAKSDTYRKRFFESVSQYRFIELNFKHLLGRAPLNQVEYSKHFKIFANGGYEAEIDSYIDDPEYDDVFGEDYMPYTRFRGTYAPINQFNRMCTLEGGFAGSDKFKPQALVTSLASNVPTPAFSIVDGLPSIPNSEHPSRKFELPSVSLERFQNELEIAKAKALELQVELNVAYSKLQGSRNYVDPFKAMVADMNITPLYGRNYGTGAVKVFSGQFEGAPAASWGPSGVKNISGPTRKPAVDIAKKEKQLERTKQLIVDLERRCSVLEGERETPALTPEALSFAMEGLAEATLVEIPEPEPVVIPEEVTIVADEEAKKLEGAENILSGEVDEDDDLSGVVVPKKVAVQTARQFQDVGRLPKELMEEIEAEKKASGKNFLEGKGGKKSFPGDGSEMVIGG